MIRAAVRLLLVGLSILTLVGAAAAAPNQQAGGLTPAIVSFSADAASLNYADVEAGTAQITLSWQTANTSGQYRVVIDDYYQNAWMTILGATQTLPLSGSQTITVTLPENFGVPTYRLSLKNSMGGVVDQQFLTIPYEASAQSAPSIVSFTTMAKVIDTNQIIQSNAQLIVSWKIANRQPNTMIHFEEVMPDGSTVSADAPRSDLWLPSQGQGGIVPHITSAKDPLHFRMELTDLSGNTVYAQKDLVIPVVGQVVLAPSNPQPQAETVHPQTAQNTNNQTNNNSSNNNSTNDNTTQGQAETVQPQTFSASQSTINGNQIQDFSAESTTVPAGGDVTLNWNAGDASSVDLLETVSNNGPVTLYIELPPTGTLNVPLPADTPGVTYTLRAHGSNGQISTGEVNVTQSSNPNGGG